MLEIGTVVYRPRWNMDNEVTILEEKITHYRYSKNNILLCYMTKNGGFSINSIGQNVYLTKEEAESNI